MVLRKSKSHYFDPHVFLKKEAFDDVELLVIDNNNNKNRQRVNNDNSINGNRDLLCLRYDKL